MASGSLGVTGPFAAFSPYSPAVWVSISESWQSTLWDLGGTPLSGNHRHFLSFPPFSVVWQPQACARNLLSLWDRAVLFASGDLPGVYEPGPNNLSVGCSDFARQRKQWVSQPLRKELGLVPSLLRKYMRRNNKFENEQVWEWINNWILIHLLFCHFHSQLQGLEQPTWPAITKSEPNCKHFCVPKWI